MAVFTLATIAGGLAALGLTVFTISQLATLAYWLAVAGGVLVGLSSFYYVLRDDYLDFLGLSGGVDVLVALISSSALGVLSYRLFESVMAVAGGVIGLGVTGFVALGFVVGFPTLIGGIFSFVEVVLDATQE